MCPKDAVNNICEELRSDEVKGSGGDQALRPVDGMVDTGRLFCSAYRRSAACRSKV